MCACIIATLAIPITHTQIYYSGLHNTIAVTDGAHSQESVQMSPDPFPTWGFSLGTRLTLEVMAIFSNYIQRGYIII